MPMRAERAAALAVALAGRRVADAAVRRAADKNAVAAAAVERRGQPHRLHARATVDRPRRGRARPAEVKPSATSPRFPRKRSAPSFAPGALRAAISTRNCSPIRRGTCCSICSRRRSRTCACRFRACASRPRSRQRRRYAGSRRWSSRGYFVRRADPHDGRRVFVELAPASEPSSAALFRRGRSRSRSSSAACPHRAAPWHGGASSRGRLAQLVEHLVYTERVGGSSPSAPTRIRD